MAPTRPEDDPVPATDLHIEATYRLTEALVEAENRMRRRVQLLSEVVFETDKSGALVFLNPAWTAALGREIPACLGQALASFVVKDDRKACEDALGGEGAAHHSSRPRLRFRRADDGIVWMEVSVAQLPGGGVVGALHDITAMHDAQEELAKLSLVASYTDNLVVITDREGRTEWVNRAFVAKTGYTLEDMRGRKPGEVLQGPSTDASTREDISRWLREGRSFKAELLNYTKARAPYWVQFQISPIRNAAGDVERFVSIQTDSTELRRTRQELEAAKERAELASEAKTQFLATISHEMRTPLNVILGSADLALDGDVAPDELQAHLQRVNASAESLLRLISDMLDVSKIEAGQFDFEHVTVDLGACLRNGLIPIGERARAKGLDFGLTLDPALPSHIVSDPDRLRQIVTNLAENAVKFTDEGSVRVEARGLAGGTPGTERLEIRVIDTGSGIDPEAQSRIFERFEQADKSTTRRKGGAGLGLNIVKSLVEALGGTVVLTSAAGQGSEFRVVLPIEPVASSAPRSVLPRAAHPTSRHASDDSAPSRGTARVLVAEDTDANFVVLEIYLSRAGYVVTRAVNGLEAVQAAGDADLILMDVEMPEMDGLEATRLIREAERTRGVTRVPILALTAHAVQGYRDRCLAAGCTGYLSKPIRKQPLLDAVVSALSGVRS